MKLNSMGARHIKCSEWKTYQLLEILTVSNQVTRIYKTLNYRQFQPKPIRKPLHPRGNKMYLWLIILFCGKGRKRHFCCSAWYSRRSHAHKKPNPHGVVRLLWLTWPSHRDPLLLLCLCVNGSARSDHEQVTYSCMVVGVTVEVSGDLTGSSPSRQRHWLWHTGN